MEGHLHAKSFGGTCNWLHTRGARLIEVAATAGRTVLKRKHLELTINIFKVGSYEPCCEKTCFMHMLKQRCRSAVR